MPIEGYNLKMRAVKSVHFIVTLILFALCRCAFLTQDIGFSALRAQLFPILLFMVAELTLIRIFNAYTVGLLETWEIIIVQQISLFLALALIGISDLILIGFSSRSAVALIVNFGLAFVWNLLWSRFADRFYRKYVPRKSAVFVCSDAAQLGLLETAFSAVGCFRIDQRIVTDSAASIEALAEELTPYHVILTAGLSHRLQNALIEYCARCGKECFLLPCVGDILLAGALPIQSLNVLSYRAGLPAVKPEYLLMKRAFDILISVCVIAVLSPLMLLCALIIRIGDGGPAIYRQQRLTLRGKVFWLYKFRSMRVDAEADGVARLSARNDARVTPFGRWMRATRIDELPQFFNILRGDMSIVGPRPERPEIAAQYLREFPDFGLRLNVKAGLTGYAQVYGKYSTDPRFKLCMDLFYICHQSPAMDLKLIFCTLGIPFMTERASGVENETEQPHA